MLSNPICISFSRRLLALLVIAAALLSSPGCASKNPTGTVSGKVTVNGKPYSNASIMLISVETGNGGGGTIEPDGSFELTDPIPVGNYTVYFAPLPVEGDVDAPPVPVHADKSIPSKYWSESSSDIKVEVVEGHNDVPVTIAT